MTEISEPEKTKGLLKGHAAMLSVEFIYAGFVIVTRLLLTEMTNIEIVVHRVLWTALISFFLLWFWAKPKFESKKDMFKIALYCSFAFYFFQAMLVFGIELTTVLHASLILALSPLMTILINRMLGREKLSWMRIVGIAIAFVGVAGLLGLQQLNGSTHDRPHWLWGDTILFFASLGFSGYLIGITPYTKQYGSMTTTAFGYLSGGIMYVLTLALAYFIYPTEVLNILTVPVRLSLPVIGGLAYLVLLASLIGYILNNYALAKLDASTVSLYIFLHPILATIAGIIILGEIVTPIMWGMMAVALIGILVAVLKPKSNQANPEQPT